MTPTHTRIRETVETHLLHHPGERDALAELLVSLGSPDDATCRTTLPGHVTCSAAVIYRDLRVPHITHRGTGALLAPGGHVETGDRTLLAAGLREVVEETAVPASARSLTPQFLGAPADINVHEIAARPAKDEPAHHHYDFRSSPTSPRSLRPQSCCWTRRCPASTGYPSRRSRRRRCGPSSSVPGSTGGRSR